MKKYKVLLGNEFNYKTNHGIFGMFKDEFDNIRNKKYIYIYILDTNNVVGDIIFSKDECTFIGELRFLNDKFIFNKSINILLKENINEIIFEDKIFNNNLPFEIENKFDHLKQNIIDYTINHLINNNYHVKGLKKNNTTNTINIIKYNALDYVEMWGELSKKDKIYDDILSKKVDYYIVYKNDIPYTDFSIDNKSNQLLYYGLKYDVYSDIKSILINYHDLYIEVDKDRIDKFVNVLTSNGYNISKIINNKNIYYAKIYFNINI